MSALTLNAGPSSSIVAMAKASVLNGTHAIERRKISQKEIKRLFEYRDGNLYWKVRTNPKQRPNLLAGSLHSGGYWNIRIGKQAFFAHRLIYCLYTGEMPLYVDHINRDRKDNRIENLRSCTHSQNHANRKIKGQGVKYRPQFKNWSARITINRKGVWLGIFKTKKLALEACQNKRIETWGDFAK